MAEVQVGNTKVEDMRESNSLSDVSKQHFFLHCVTYHLILQPRCHFTGAGMLSLPSDFSPWNKRTSKYSWKKKDWLHWDLFSYLTALLVEGFHTPFEILGVSLISLWLFVEQFHFEDKNMLRRESKKSWRKKSAPCSKSGYWCQYRRRFFGTDPKMSIDVSLTT